ILIHHCINGLKVNEEKTKHDAERSTALVTSYSMLHGYKQALKLALESIEKNQTVKETAIKSGRLTEEEAEKLFDPLLLTDVNLLHDLIQKFKSQRDI
ncbi:hypothetical protein, partial [Turicimonas muris]